ALYARSRAVSCPPPLHDALPIAVQPAQAHGLHRPRRRADVARLRGGDQDDADVVQPRHAQAPCGQRGPASVKLRMRGPVPCTARPILPGFSSSVMIKPAVSVAVKAARAAGNVILRRMARLDAIPVAEKDRFDFASEVDRQAEAEIIRELSRAYPGHAILGEETGARGKCDTVWVIDPLDGTHNYLRGFPHFCVSIAQMVRGQPEVAVVFDP